MHTVHTPSATARLYCRFGYSGGARIDVEPGEGGPGLRARYACGTLEVLQRDDPLLARAVMTARLRTEQGKEAAPDLFDAQLLSWSADAISLVGFERDVLTRRDTVQSWLFSGTQLNRYSCQLIRDSGRPKPRWIQSQGKWHAGQVSLAEELDPVLGRWLPVARFRSTRQDTELLPPLLNAKLIQWRENRVVLTGIDRHPESGVEEAQTWLLIQADHSASGAGVLWGGAS